MQSPTFRFGLALTLFGLAACSTPKGLLTVESDSVDGKVELTYKGEQSADNLVREVRFDAAGDTTAITHLLKGLLHGELVTFHPLGTRKESVVYVNGIQDGAYRAYDTEGAVVFEGYLKGGKKQGQWTTWYDATQKRQQCQYDNDVMSGKCTYWYIDGNIQREETYSLGKLVASQDY
ncbi:MAG: hypothetical protein K9J06_07455 [Flavobacteriales bacterium]|nr:hypothetical protein [Flavobacteriales bacterium]